MKTAHLLEDDELASRTMCGKILSRFTVDDIVATFSFARREIGVGKFDRICDHCRKSPAYEKRVHKERGEPVTSHLPVSISEEDRLIDLGSGVDVVSWHDTPEPTGHPVAVGIMIPAPGQPKGARGLVRLKSATVTDQVIDALIEHRMNVWPHVRQGWRTWRPL